MKNTNSVVTGYCGHAAATHQELESPDDKPPHPEPPERVRRLFDRVLPEQWNDWRWQFKNRVTRAEDLSRYFTLSPKQKTDIIKAMEKYPMAITPYYLSLIDPDDPYDPIRIQAVPCVEEIALTGYGQKDPLAEKEDSVVPGLVHRYPDRCLMVLTNICPMLCRHCTRKREWAHGTWVYNEARLKRMLDYIRSNRQIRDVIISGGDVLSLSTQRLERVIVELRSISHVEIIRIGTRCPVVLPQRIDAELCDMLSQYGPIWLNTHFNHPRELTHEAARACDRLLRSGIPVNNQSVLLKGVNDDPQTQTDLCQGLLRIKVRPYYLFQTDDVEGTEHLRTPIETGIEIISAMRGHTSGLAVPQFVVDLPGGGGKVQLQPEYLLCRTENEYVFRNFEGKIIHCRNPRSRKYISDDPTAGDQAACSVLTFPQQEAVQ
jgi:lysine 2,3-aminomutase